LLELLELFWSRDELDEPFRPPLRELSSELLLDEPLMPSPWLLCRSAMVCASCCVKSRPAH
jgi:hypothetical protein